MFLQFFTVEPYTIVNKDLLISLSLSSFCVNFPRLRGLDGFPQACGILALVLRAGCPSCAQPAPDVMGCGTTRQFRVVPKTNVYELITKVKLSPQIFI